MKIVFLGTGEIAIPSFRALIASEHEVLALVTQPDKPIGRRSEPQPPAIKLIAQEAGIPVLQPAQIRAAEALTELEALDAEVMVVMAYGQILPQKLIEMPTRAIINLHASLLPKYRGASCIQSALLNGDSETGWTVMHVVKALDAGDIIQGDRLKISLQETGESLHDRLAVAGPESLLSALETLANGSATRTPQDEAMTSYSPKLDREAGRIDWSQSAVDLERRIRAFHTWPGTFTTFIDSRGKEKRMKVFPPVEVIEAPSMRPSSEAGQVLENAEDFAGIQVACGIGGLKLSLVQAEGSKRMTGEEFLRGVDVTTFG